jgi:hypothetical protein
LVHNYLEKGGLFIFDVNTEYRYKEVYDQKSYVYEFEDSLTVWRSAYSPESKLCEFDIDIFQELENGDYFRDTEYQTQRFFPREEIISAASGFELVEESGGKGFDGCTENEKEYYIFKKN